MTEYKIYCDYINAKLKAEELEQIARSIKSSAKIDEEVCRGYLSSNWQGDAMNVFGDKCFTVITERLKTAQELSRIACTIRSIAERNYKTEMKAIQIARSRKYSGGGGGGGGGGGF